MSTEQTTPTAANACEQLLDNMRTLQLSTVSEGGEPHCGYTPYLRISPNQFYIFVSQLSAHTRDMLATGKASIMVIQDEADAKQLFARTRVSYQCNTQVIERSSSNYPELLDAYETRHGKMAGLLRQLPDFHLIELVPLSGQFVMGFGKAYHLEGESLQTFVHARTG